MALKVTVLMPVYNGERFLRKAIDSVLSQTFSDFEFIIVDDGSTDATPELEEVSPPCIHSCGGGWWASGNDGAAKGAYHTVGDDFTPL